MGFRVGGLGFWVGFRVGGLGGQGFGLNSSIEAQFAGFLTQRPQSSSFLGLPYRILNINLQKELLWGLWVEH